MLKAKTSILLLFLLTTCACFSSSKTEVSKIGVDEKGNPLKTRNGKTIKMDGVFYALPRTRVKVRVPIKRDDQYPGKFADFVKCFLPHKAEDAIMNRSTAFSIGTPEFSERGVPDFDEVYMIRIKGGYFEDKSLTLGLTEAGVFTSVDATSEDRSVDVALGVLDTALDVGTQIAGMNLASKLARGTLSASLPTNVETSAAKATGEKTSANTDSKGGKPQEDQLSPQQFECYKKMEAAYIDEKLMKAKYKKVVEGKLKTEYQKELNRRVDKRVEEELDTSLPQAQQDRLKAQIRIEESDKTRAGIRDDIKKVWLGEAPFPGDPALIPELADVRQALNIIRKHVKDSYEEAKQSFAQIKAKQDQLDALIAGTALPDTNVDALKLTIEQIKAEIDTLSARYFLGWKKSDEWIGNFEFDPPDILPNAPPKDFNSELFTFSAAGGICNLKQTQGNKVKPNFTIAEKCTAEFSNDQIKVALQITRDEKLLASTISKAIPIDSDRRERGFYYRVPGVALVRLMTTDATNNPTEKARKPDVQIAQYGTTASLPASTGGRTTKYVLSLFETSGAMKNFTLGSDALITKSQVEELNSTVNATLEAKAKRKQAEIDAELESKDELKRLKREREILEEKNKIEAEKKKLQGTTP